jgi:hypothetical protein
VRIRIKLGFILIVLLLGIAVDAGATEKVEYISDSIAEKDGDYIRLLGGSSWVLSYYSLALVTADIIIVFQTITTEGNKTVTVAVAYVDGEEIPARHVGGTYAAETGYLTTVVESFGDGAVLKLEDGTLLSIPEYDRYDTGWWLPPYKALVTGNGMYLWNLKKGKRIWINIVK